MKLVFILVDALKSSYLTEENMPFLYGLSKKGRYIEEILPSAGFCERSEIFSGLDSYDTGNFTAIGYKPEDSVYKHDKLILAIASIAERVNYKIARHIFGLLRKKLRRRMNIYRIPFKSLYNFALTEDGCSKFVKHDTIFDELNKSNLSYTLDAFTSLADLGARTKESALSFVKRNVREKIDFIPYYIGLIDSAGHKYGGDIQSIRIYLKHVDDELRSLYYISKNEGYAFAILGDHGMVPITNKVNIMGVFDNLPLKHLRDYEVFYDSTTVRFWFNNKHAEDVVRYMLESKFSAYGKIIDRTNYQNYRIPLDLMCNSGKPIYGDLVWFANAGVLVSPDYFHKATASEKGMHGYLEIVHGEGTGLYIAVGEKVDTEFIHEAHSYSVCSELCKILEINTPNSNKWKRKIL